MEQPESNPTFCTNNCGFYGSSQFEGMCSKCFREQVNRSYSTGRTNSCTSFYSSSNLSVTSPNILEDEVGTDNVISPIENDNSKEELKQENHTSPLLHVASAPTISTTFDSPTKNDTDIVESSSLSASPINSSNVEKKKRNRCTWETCNKKLGLTGFDCRCGGQFCSLHRYANEHNCTFDYKEHGQNEIRKNMPVVQAERMAGFDDVGVFFSDNFGADNNNEFDNENDLNRASIKKKFKMFIREFHINNLFIYREMLRRNYNSRRYWIDIELRHLSDYDDNLCDHLKKQPAELLPLFEEAAKEVADEITRPRPDDDVDMHDIQIMLMNDAHPLHLRHLKSEYVSKLVKTVGIVIAASSVRTKASHIAVQCRSCRNVISNIKVKPGLEGYAMPRKCNSVTQPGQPPCPLDPYFVMPDKCQCIDFQILKLQEAPEFVPHGEMPKHIQLYCDRNLVDRAMPGNKITLVGIYCIKRNVAMGKMNGKEKSSVGTRQPYVRVLGIRIDTDGVGRSSAQTLTTAEEEEFVRFSHSSDVYETIANSIAPSIYGASDVKKAVAC
ncbi:unnamed protein product, partial [Adineta ricciae]